jgi:2-phosphosulfolactate phosphatase
MKKYIENVIDKTDLSKQENIHVTVIIDAFRAFATASYVLALHPKTYMITNKCSVIARLASDFANPITIGKPEKNSDLIYEIPNSPTRVLGLKVTGRNVLHRTEAGAKGILSNADSDVILAVGFVNASATVKYIKTLTNPKLMILPMGHEATTPSLEDQVCANYIESLMCDKKIELARFIPDLKKGSGKYFFSIDQWQYPEEDFKRCLDINRFNFAIKAVVKDDYAILCRCK